MGEDLVAQPESIYRRTALGTRLVAMTQPLYVVAYLAGLPASQWASPVADGVESGGRLDLIRDVVAGHLSHGVVESPQSPADRFLVGSEMGIEILHDLPECGRGATPRFQPFAGERHHVGAGVCRVG